MSGEVVAAPIAPLAVIGIGVGIAAIGVGACAFGVAKIVKAIVDNRVEAARKQMDEEKARLREWQTYQEKQRQQMISLQTIQESITESEKRLSAMTLTEGFSDRKGEGPTAKGYTSSKKAKKSQQEVIFMLDDVVRILNGLPSEFREAPDSLHSRLLKQEVRIRQKTEIDTAEVESFREAILRTMTSYMNSIEMAAKQKTVVSQRLESLFNEVLVCSHLASETRHINELDSIKANLLNMMNSENILIGQVEFLEKRFEGIKSEVEFSLSNTAFRSSLADSITRNLAEMGYRVFEGFPPDGNRGMMKAVMRIPGGERLRIAIQRDNRMSFQVCHESGRFEGQLSGEELAVFRSQEGKWCKDLRELIKRLTAEGFEYVVSLERLTPEVSVPIVVVETAEEILAEAEKENIQKRYKKPKKRYLG